MRKELDREDTESFVLGSDISVDTLQKNKLFISEKGRVVYFLGLMDQSLLSDDLYYDSCEVAQYQSAKRSRSFITLRGGVIEKTGFLLDQVKYRIVQDRHMVFPGLANTFFGIVRSSDRKESVKLTRALFGGTSDEILEVASVFAKLIGRWGEYPYQPRITLSQVRNNTCDVSGCVIPRKFPYLAFAESDCLWGHVSLYGFYRLLDMCCSSRVSGPVRRRMIDDGISTEVLDRLTACARDSRKPLLRKH